MGMGERSKKVENCTDWGMSEFPDSAGPAARRNDRKGKLWVCGEKFTKRR